MGKCGEQSLISKTSTFNPEHLPEERRKKALVMLSGMDADSVKAKSMAVCALYEWVCTINSTWRLTLYPKGDVQLIQTDDFHFIRMGMYK